MKAEVKTKRGEIVKAQFGGAHAYSGGSVSPEGGRSDVGVPLVFTYRAPSKKASNAGFEVSATSRAGIAPQGVWTASLGTGWSGQISCIREDAGPPFSVETLSYSNLQTNRMTIDLKDGAGTTNGYGEIKNLRTFRRPAVRGGGVVYLFESSDAAIGTVEATSPTTVDVQFTNGTYVIKLNDARALAPGKQHSVACRGDQCQEQDLPLYFQSCLPPGGGIGGTTGDPNQLHGSINEVKPHWDGRRNVTQTWTVIWDLARQGTSR